MGLRDKVATLLKYLKAGTSRRIGPERLLHLVLVDAARTGLTKKALREVEELGVRVVDVPLISPGNGPYLDDRLLAEALLSLV